MAVAIFNYLPHGILRILYLVDVLAES